MSVTSETIVDIYIPFDYNQANDCHENVSSFYESVSNNSQKSLHHSKTGSFNDNKMTTRSLKKRSGTVTEPREESNGRCISNELLNVLTIDDTSRDMHKKLVSRASRSSSSARYKRMGSGRSNCTNSNHSYRTSSNHIKSRQVRITQIDANDSVYHTCTTLPMASHAAKPTSNNSWTSLLAEKHSLPETPEGVVSSGYFTFFRLKDISNKKPKRHLKVKSASQVERSTSSYEQMNISLRNMTLRRAEQRGRALTAHI